MLGRFDDDQQITANGQSIATGGPLEWDLPPDQGKKIVKIKVEFIQNNRNCNGDANDLDLTPDNDRWDFTMRNNDMQAGPATAKGELEAEDGTKVRWEQDVTIVAA